MEQITELEHTKKTVRSILNARATRITTKELNKLYLELLGTNIPFSKHGFRSLNVFLESMPDVVRLVNSSHHTYLYPVRSNDSGHILQLNNDTITLRNKKNGTVHRNHEDQFRVNLSSNKPLQPVTCMPKHSSDRTKQNAKYENNATRSHHILHEINSNVPRMYLVSNRQQQPAYDTNLQSSTTINASKCNSRGGIRLKQSLNLSDHLSAFPKANAINIVGETNSMSIGNTVFKLPDIQILLESEKSVAICITEVRTPYKFWFQTTQQIAAFRTLGCSLRKFYESSYSAKIQKDKVTSGLVCAYYSRQEHFWYRAEVKNYSDGDRLIKISLVDTGVETKVSLDDLRILRIAYTKTPNLCYEGCLMSVRPVGPTWTLSDSTKFAKLVLDKIIFAENFLFDNNKKRVHMKLIDTNHDNDTSLSEALVEMGIAQIEN